MPENHIHTSAEYESCEECKAAARCEESPRTRERLFNYLRHKSDCPMFVNASDYEKVWDAHSGTCHCNCGLKEAYREWATRETRGTPPDAHRTLQAIFNELNDPESGESERWVKIEEILHQYFRGPGTHPPQEGWISVEERLPEKKLKDDESPYEYLCIDRYGDIQVYEWNSELDQHFSETTKWVWWTYGGVQDTNVTHWQPLPKPPACAPSAPAKEPE